MGKCQRQKAAENHQMLLTCVLYIIHFTKITGIVHDLGVSHQFTICLFYQLTWTVQVQLLAKYERITILLIVLLSGCRNLGYSGTDCSIPCPQNCLYGVCDIINGDCPGCVAGYKGRTCNEGLHLDFIYNIIHINITPLYCY